MRKVTFGGANSLDNYIARKDHSVDWLMWSDETADILKDYWKTIDTIVMGRKTFEAGLKYSKGKNPYPGMKSYVLSRTLDAGENEGFQIVNEDAAEFVQKLKAEEGKDICIMGGGELGKSLLEAGLIDEIGFNIHPVLLGQGIPLFHEMNRQIDLELTECRPLKNGCVYVLYKVKN